MDKLDLIYDITKEIKQDVKHIKKEVANNTKFRFLVTRGSAILVTLFGIIFGLIRWFR